MSFTLLSTFKRILSQNSNLASMFPFRFLMLPLENLIVTFPPFMASIHASPNSTLISLTCASDPAVRLPNLLVSVTAAFISGIIIAPKEFVAFSTVVAGMYTT